MKRADPQQASTLVELLHRRATDRPNDTACIFLVDGEEEEDRITYGELDRRARAIAASLQAIGPEGERALLLYPPGIDYITAFFGCLYAGMVAVPVYPPEPTRLNRSLPRLQAIEKNAGASIVLTISMILGMVDAIFELAPDLKVPKWLATDNLEAGLQDRWKASKLSPQTLAFLQYTSGSTGDPKGVMLTHENLLYNEEIIKNAFSHSDQSIVLGWLPPYHDMGLIGIILQPLYLGVPCILMSPLAFLQHPIRWLKAMSRYKATTSGAPNFAYDLCVRKVSSKEREGLDLSHWDLAFSGAEPVRAETIERFSEHFKPCGFRREAFYPCYGLAEATLIVSGGLKTKAPIVESFKNGNFMVGCGKTLGDQRIEIVNPETCIPCAPGEEGEIWVSGKSIAQGYWRHPEETQRTFGATLKDTGEGPFLRTGDLGFLKDGELFVTGRIKDIIIIRGQNLYPHDIELTAERSHPSLRPGCGAAFSVESDGEERLVIVHEVDTRQPVDLASLIKNVRRAVAENHQVHVHEIVLIEPRSLPKTSSGKIQRRTCRENFLSGTLSVVRD